MNERIRKLAEQAGFEFWQDEPWNPGDLIDWSARYDDEFIRFTELIIAAEREACARVCEAFINGSAGLVDNTAQVCAEAIRARGGE